MAVSAPRPEPPTLDPRAGSLFTAFLQGPSWGAGSVLAGLSSCLSAPTSLPSSGHPQGWGP